MKHTIVKSEAGELYNYKNAIMHRYQTFYTLDGHELCNQSSHFEIKMAGVESDIHKCAKVAIEWMVNNKIPIKIKCRRTEVDEITAHYAKQEQQIPGTDNYADVMLYNEDGSINCIIEICHTNKTKEVSRSGYIWYELNAEDVLETEDYVYTCIRDYPVVYMNQLGAGNGKTYRSVKLIEENENVDTFIYVTKVHSAKDAIKGKFTEIFGDEVECIRSNDDKKFYYSFYNGKRVVICTIDYLYYCLTKLDIDKDTHTINDKGVFELTAEYITSNPLVTRIVPFVECVVDEDDVKMKIKETIILDRNTMLIVDEAQDLNIAYTRAYFSITSYCKLICYVIGDRLQSLTQTDSLYQNKDLLEVLCKEYGVYYVYNELPNICQRFNNEEHMHFVNNVLSNKVNIVGTNSSYIPTNGLKAVNVIVTNITYREKHDVVEVVNDDFDLDNSFYNDIIERVEKEVDTNAYTPENFMFIFPIVNRLKIAEPLLTRLREFWQQKMQDENYRSKLNEDNYWLTVEDYDNAIYCVYHRSEDGKPIDLNESRYQTRFLSIDASKGNGCEVVFLLNFTHDNLKTRVNCINNYSEDINYLSFIHVAITRQKNSIYVYLDNSKLDPLHDMFKDYIDSSIILSNRHVNNTGNIRINPDKLKVSDFYDDTIEVNNIFNEKNTKMLIDMSYHNLRTYAIKTILYIRCIGDRHYSDFAYKMCLIDEIVGVTSREYYKWLKGKKAGSDEKSIKIMQKGDTDIVLNIIRQAILKIQRLCNGSPAKFCPLEYIVIAFSWELLKNRQYSDFTCTDLYRVMSNYKDIASNTHKDIYDCGCPGGNDDIGVKNKIVNFINTLDSISDIVNKVEGHIFKTTGNLMYEYESGKYVVMEGVVISYKFIIFDPLRIRDINVYLIQPTLDLMSLPRVLVKAELVRFMIKNDKKFKNADTMRVIVKVVTSSFKELIDLDYYKDCRLGNVKIKEVIKDFIDKNK